MCDIDDRLRFGRRCRLLNGQGFRHGVSGNSRLHDNIGCNKQEFAYLRRNRRINRPLFL